MTDIAQGIWIEMKSIFDSVVEHYHDDINHDLSFLSKHIKNIERGHTLHWSVGDCGSHIGIIKSGENPLWMYPNASYNKYLHFQVLIKENEFAFKRVHLDLTDKKYLDKLNA